MAATRNSSCRSPTAILLIAVAVIAQIACLGDVEVPPQPPTLQPLTSPVFVAYVDIGGTKPAGTAVFNFDSEIVPLDQKENWTARLPLVLGSNAIKLHTQIVSGIRSNENRSPTASVTYDRPCPGAPISTLPPATTTSTSHVISGTKGNQTSVELNGVEISEISATGGTCTTTCNNAPSVSCTADADCDNTWQHTITLIGGDQEYDFELVAIDAEGKLSAPVQFTIELDTTPPQITSTYPDMNAGTPLIDVPTNAFIIVAFDESLEPGNDTGRLTVSDATFIRGEVVYSVSANTLRWRPQLGDLQANTTYTVHIEDGLIDDKLGNVRVTGTTPDWTFTTRAGVDTSPPTTTPTVSAPTAPVRTPTTVITGTKDPWTSIWIEGINNNDAMIVPVDDQPTWSYEVPLALDLDFSDTVTTLILEVRSVADVALAFPAPVSITRTSSRPDQPTIDPGTETSVTTNTVSLSGTKPAGTAVLLDGRTIVCSSDETVFSFLANLIPGINELKLTTQDATGAGSSETMFLVNFEQDYQGTVPDNFRLKVFLTLRDLSNTQGLRWEWVDGPSLYGVEAWVEGPIEPGEVCEIVDHERQNIKYVATIQSYLGNKTGREVPYFDADYAGTDFLAAMITGGVFNFSPFNLDATTDRRDVDGRFRISLLTGITETQVRSNYDCYGLVDSPILDECTKATRGAGPLPPTDPLPQGWIPRLRGGSTLLEQGDYLLNILINLDRNGQWIFDNDFETCWGDPSHNDRGMHRVVRRISLGSTPYSIRLPQSEERSGPDRDGSGRLHYVDVDGVTIFWGPN